jgi:hypothetical protein
MKVHNDAYRRLCEVLEDMFCWMAEKVSFFMIYRL